VPSRLKSAIQYIVILGVTIVLIYFSLRGLKVAEGEDKWDYLKGTWDNAHKGWLAAMAVLSIISHVMRAERWRMLLKPVGFDARLSSSFLSLMVGYLINLIIPRGGEISRSYNLYKLDKIPVIESFGTVVIERIVDLVCLMLVIVISFLFESKKLFAFIGTLPLSTNGSSKFIILLYALPVLLIFGLLFYWILKTNKKINTRVRKLWASFRDGMLSILKLERKGLFTFYSCFIWILYFAMSYTVLKAFPATSTLGFNAVLSLFAIGAIAMAAPLPGGMGSYHVLVPQGLFFLYNVPLPDAVAFTFIFHGWQTALYIVFGALSLVVTSFVVKKDSARKRTATELSS
jgi:glycosyltransferase 2 family protein